MTTTTTDEIAPDVFRITTLVENGVPGGFVFNQYVVRDDDPFLFHTGTRELFPAVSAAVDDLVGLDRLRWVSFGHVEADECGSMNQFLEVAPRAEVVHGLTACLVSLMDLADRPPHAIGDDEVLDLGTHRLRYLPTPHVPHSWESGLWFDETTSTLFCGDLFTQVGDGPAVVTDDIVASATLAEQLFSATAPSSMLRPTLERLAELNPSLLAVMHGSCFRGDGGGQLRALADAYDSMSAA